MQAILDDNRGRLASFYNDDQPRVPSGNSDGGQWVAATGSTYQKPWAAPVRNFLARETPPTPAEVSALASHLHSLTTEQLRGLRADHGVAASASTKKVLVQKLREKFTEARGKNAAVKPVEAAKSEPMPSAAQTTSPTKADAAPPPKLHGTEKQVAFAESVRSRVLRDAEKYVAHREATKHPDAADDREALEHLKGETSARFWIDHRGASLPEMFGRMHMQHAPFSADVDDDRGRLVADFAAHKFSSTQFNLADGGYSRSQGSPAPKLTGMAKAIPDSDLADDGREEEPHVTVKYGLHTSDADEVRKALKGFGPVQMALGKTSIFPAKEASAQRGGDAYDVVKVDVDSPDLHRLNKHLSKSLKHTDTHPEYKPHVTLAYVKPGLGKKYVGDSTVDGHKLSLSRLVFSDQDGKRTMIPLTGEKADFADDTRGRLVAAFDADDAGGPEDEPAGQPEEVEPMYLGRLYPPMRYLPRHKQLSLMHDAAERSHPDRHKHHADFADDNRGRLAEFYSPDQPRDNAGKWTAGAGDDAAREHSIRQIREFAGKSEPASREELEQLGGHLSRLTVKQLRQVRDEHGLKGSGPDKEQFVAKLGERFVAHRAGNALTPAEARGTGEENKLTNEALRMEEQAPKPMTMPAAAQETKLPEADGPNVSENDIPYQTAYAAHQGTSFSPEIRAKQRQRDWVETMTADHEDLSKLANTPEKREQLKAEFERYKAGYKERYLAYLHSNSRIVSSMIAGPSNFPVRQMEKRGDAAHNKLNELLDYRKRAKAAIERKLTPELQPIKTADSDATSRLKEKLAQHEALQERMKAINNAHKAFLKNPASLDKADLTEADKGMIRNYKPAYSWEPHPYPPYRLTNNNATIRQVKERIGQVEKLQATPHKEEDRGGVKIVENPDLGRIQLKFPGKPDSSTIATLKQNGFRWAPSEGAWQRHLNNGGRAAADYVLQKISKAKEGAASFADELDDGRGRLVTA